MQYRKFSGCLKSRYQVDVKAWYGKFLSIVKIQESNKILVKIVKDKMMNSPLRDLARQRQNDELTINRFGSLHFPVCWDACEIFYMMEGLPSCISFIRACHGEQSSVFSKFVFLLYYSEGMLTFLKSCKFAS